MRSVCVDSHKDMPPHGRRQFHQEVAAVAGCAKMVSQTNAVNQTDR